MILKRRIIGVVKRQLITFRQVIDNPNGSCRSFGLLRGCGQCAKIEAIVDAPRTVALIFSEDSSAVAVKLVAVALLRKPDLVERQTSLRSNLLHRVAGV